MYFDKYANKFKTIFLNVSHTISSLVNEILLCILIKVIKLKMWFIN